MENVKISIIIPVYNIQNYIARCLDSILGQTLTEFEVICVNDGSIDNSVEVIKRYMDLDSRIKLINQKNAGPGAARNNGIRNAKGDYIGFVDGDDFIEKDMFEALYSKAVKYNADVAISNANLFYPSDGKKVLFRDYNKMQMLDNMGSFTAWEYPWVLTLIGMWDRIFKREFVEKIKFYNPEGRFYEDHLPSYMSSVLAEKMVIVNQANYNYRQQRSDSTIGKEREVDFFKFHFVQDYKEVREFLVNQNVYDHYREAFLEYKLPMALMHQMNLRKVNVFCNYFNQLKEQIDDNDFETIKSNNYYNSKAIKCYTKCLKKRNGHYTWFLFWLIRHFHKDEYYYYIHIPKKMEPIKIKRRHFYWNGKMEYMSFQIDNLSKQIEKLNNNLEDKK